MKLPAVIVFLCFLLINAKFIKSGLESSQENSVRSDYTHISGRLRLAGGKSVTDGRLEIYVDGNWKWICTKNFTSVSAKVTCRQLGFVGGKVDAHAASASADSSSASLAISVSCSGSEADLLTCAIVSDAPMNTTVDRCAEGAPVAVTCSQDADAVVGVRLRDSYVPGSGRLEVFSGNSWRTVCRNGFNEASARVACRQLGLHDGSPDNKTLAGLLPVAMAASTCDGTEMRLQDCRPLLLQPQQQQQQQPTAAARIAEDCNNLQTVGIVCSPVSSLLLTLAILPHQPRTNTELNVAGLNGIFYFEASGCADFILLLYSSINRRRSSYLKINLFQQGSVAQGSETTNPNPVSAHVVSECESEVTCTEIADVRYGKSHVVSSFNSCRSFRPLMLIWRRGVGAVVVPQSSHLKSALTELEAAVETLLDSADQVIRWRATSLDGQKFTHVGFGSGSYELAVRIYRNSSWLVNRCLLTEMEFAGIQVCGSNTISKTLCLQCGCCFNPSSLPSCYFSRASDVDTAPASCVQKNFSELFGRILFLSESDEVYRNDDLSVLVLLERTVDTASLEIQYNDGSSSDVIKMADLVSDERSPLPVWASAKLPQDVAMLKFYRTVRRHTYSKVGEYYVFLSVTDLGNPAERILRNLVVFVSPRPPIPGYFRSILFINSGPVRRFEEVQVVLMYQNSTVTPDFDVTVDMADGTILSLNFDRGSPVDYWILKATGLEGSVGATYHRGRAFHLYKEAGIFTADVSITSEKWTFPWETFHLRTAIVVSCSALDLNLKNAGSSRNRIQGYSINQFVLASLVITQGCRMPIDTGNRSVEWSVYPLKNLTSAKNESTKIIIPSSDSNPDELKIAPFTLEPGFYIVQAQMMVNLDASDEAHRPKSYKIEGWIAIFTPTMSKARERQSLAVSINETVLVDVSRDSEKLKFLQVTTKPIYRWGCLEYLARPDEIQSVVIQLKVNHPLVDSCFRLNRLPSGLSSQVLAFDADQLSFVLLPATFTFVWLAGDPKLEVVVWGNRFVTVANDSRVLIDIVCHSNCAQHLVAKDDREVILEAICARESCEREEALSYAWEVHAVDVNRSYERPIQVHSRLDQPRLVLNTKTLRRELGGYIYSIMVTVTKLRTGVSGSRLYRLVVDRQMAVISGRGSWLRTKYHSMAVIVLPVLIAVY